ncbi:hypothetical protein CAPTEDRAFT_172563 [Capitella teleta]|uniref:polyribonucleotide nucleotidyltransferase n=1 Tax=Capitella teleta TaxID=283909 RepID=R7U8S1_CAPTE|nr:hypothetical protein CAPTEDRAFT_172563 [Capitella teleta]|eukprot:ELT99515.1 hypothetical protein CAPTEDRAFT_172563 [Capitella teleta]
MGNTVVMATAVGKQNRGGPAPTFLPLTVDYMQKASAAGRIPTNFLRRELGQSVTEVLISRLTDRSIRPLFPKDYFNETQIVCNLLAVDGVHDPEVCSINAASTALALSDIPWNGPVGAVRIGCIDDEVIFNPTRKQLAKSSMNLILAGTLNSKIVMIEGSGKSIPPSLLKNVLRAGSQQAEEIATSIKTFAEQNGRPKRTYTPQETIDSEVESALNSLSLRKLEEILTDESHHKISRDQAISSLKGSVLNSLREQYPEVESVLLAQGFDSLCKKTFRSLIFSNNTRCDGRALTDLRDISCEVDILPPLHGSSLFQRGQTQVMSSLTFDSPDSAAKMDNITAEISGIEKKNFFLHYEFPPYATNETGRSGSIGRREIGHGALAERSLVSVIPDDYPFTIRLTAEVLESNGSSSMASACAGSLALMDAGVPISAPVAGIAVGMVTKTDEASGEIVDSRILTDLLGIEDYMGDMDFKVAGTRDGVTAIQADVKLPGVPIQLINAAMTEASVGMQRILDIMAATLPGPRSERKANTPILETIKIPRQKKSQFVGFGGCNLKAIKNATGVTITFSGEDDFQLFAPNPDAMAEAQEQIKTLMEHAAEQDVHFEFGAIYKAKIEEIRDYGVMVRLHPNKAPVLLHNSQLERNVSHPSALGLEVGQELNVKYFGMDPASGRMRLSQKILSSLPSSNIHSFHK